MAGSAVEAFWSGTSFLLASTIFQPILGSLSGIFGRKWLIHFSLLLFLVGSVVIAASVNFTTILIGRTFQGAGGGGIICVTALIVVDKISLRERGKWLSLLGAMWSVGTVSGPLLGGLYSIPVLDIVDKINFRWRVSNGNVVALDFLDQSSFHRYRWNIDRDISNSRREKWILCKKVERSRLGWNESLSFINDRISYFNQPWWHRIPVELVAYTCTAAHLYCWPFSACCTPGVCGKEPLHSYKCFQEPICSDRSHADGTIRPHSLSSSLLPTIVFRGSEGYVTCHGWGGHFSLDLDSCSMCYGMFIYLRSIAVVY